MKRVCILGLLLWETMLGQNRSIPLEIPLTGSNSPVGRVVLRETMKGALNFDITVQALTRGEHAVHIHEYGVCDGPDFKTAGPHFNPESKQHGWDNPSGHHAGDLSENILVDADGNGHLNVTTTALDLHPGSSHSILGRSIVIHEKADDRKTDPSGNSGNRIACGIVPNQSSPAHYH